MPRINLNITTLSLASIILCIIITNNGHHCENLTVAPVEDEYSTESLLLQWTNRSTTNCSNNEYRCIYSGECIPIEWTCDRLLDCADGSDEYPHFQKPTDRPMWNGPDVCELCSSSYFRCTNSAECIPRGWGCDGKYDCGNVDAGRDESDEDPQICKNLREIHTVEEVPAHNLTKIKQDAVPSIAIIDLNEIRFVQNLFSINQTVTRFRTTVPSGKLIPIVSTTDQDKFCAFYQLNSSILCWSISNQSAPTIYTLPIDLNAENIVSIVPDSNTGNWYLLEQDKDRVILCDPNMGYCIVILDHRQLSHVQALDVDPTEGLMFIAQAGDQAQSDTSERNSCILKCSLDGLETVTLVDTALINPTFVTIDTQKRRLFWIDSYLESIECIDYDGKNRIKFESKVFPSPWWNGMHLQVFSNQAIVFLKNVARNNVTEHQIGYMDLDENIVTLKNIYVQSSDVPVSAVRARYVTVLTKIIRLICGKCHKGEVCVPKFDYITRQIITTTCLRGRYWPMTPWRANIDMNDTVEALLVYSRSSPGLIKVRQLRDELIGNMDLSLAKCATWFDVDHGEMVIYYIDDCRGTLIVQSLLLPENYPAMVYDLTAINLKHIEAVAMDQSSRNIYVVESKLGVIEVINIQNKTLYHKRLITGLDNVKTLVLDSDYGLMFFSQYGHRPDDKDAWMEDPDSGPWIKKASLDGSNGRILANGPSIRYPNCLTLDRTNRLLYWGDFNRIERIDYNGDHRKLLIKSIRIGIITSMDLFRDHIYWSELQHGTIQRHNMTANLTEVVLQESAPIYQLKLIKYGVVYRGKPFSSSCSQLTLKTSNGRRCVCSDEYQIDPYNASRCVLAQEHPIKPVNVTPTPLQCSPKEFACDQNTKCIPFHWVCDGHRDCMDITDEASERACRGTTCPQGYFRCQSRNLCLEPSWRCDGVPDCGPDDNSDETDC